MAVYRVGVGGGAFRGRFMLRPLEEPVRTWTSRRGGGGADAGRGRLRRPRPPCSSITAFGRQNSLG